MEASLNPEWKLKLFQTSKKRVIDKLRELYPEGRWKYNHQLFYWYNKKLKMEVSAVSQFAPTWPDDYSTCITRYQINYPTGEYLPFCGPTHYV